MSAVRCSRPGHAVKLIDQGPAPAGSSARPGGRIAVPGPTTPEEHRKAKLREYQQRHRERLKEAA